MTRDQLGLVVYVGIALSVFLGFEIPAALHLTPWPTLSTEFEDGVKAWPPLRDFGIAFLFVLGLHLCFRLSALPLILVAAGTAAGLCLHFLR